MLWTKCRPIFPSITLQKCRKRIIGIKYRNILHIEWKYREIRQLRQLQTPGKRIFQRTKIPKFQNRSFESKPLLPTPSNPSNVITRRSFDPDGTFSRSSNDFHSARNMDAVERLREDSIRYTSLSSREGKSEGEEGESVKHVGVKKAICMSAA